MKNKVGNMLGLLSMALLLVVGAAWAKTYRLQPTSITPGATGTVDAKADKTGGNTDVRVTVDHLARPTLLTPQANEYVVWLEPEDGSPQNQGLLRVGDNEKGDLKMTTTSSKFKILVTAESDAHPKAPSNRVVLRAEVQE
jgi:hypothetical protein